MKFILLILLFTSTIGPLLSQNISVKVMVKSNDENISNRIKSRVNNKLHELKNIELTDSDTARFKISMDATSINNNVKIFIASILTKRVTCGNEKIFKILTSVTNVEDDESLEKKCDDLIARFDTFFEQER